jgi:hypothetical protein
MKPRIFGIALATIMYGTLYTIVAANLLLDPEGIFGINSAPRNPNSRYSVFMTYQRDPLTYDALLFGSSRAMNVPLNLLSRHMGVAHVASFAVRGGSISDFLPAVEYVVKTRAGSDKPLRKVFLELDLDLFGLRMRSDPQVWLPPQYTGESSWQFRWRYLTILQFSAWSSEFGWKFQRNSVAPPERPTKAPAPAAGGAEVAAQTAAGSAAAVSADEMRGARDNPLLHLDFAAQIDKLRQLATLCRANGIELTAIVSPLQQVAFERLDANGAAEALRRIAETVPVWDFGHPKWLSDSPDLWIDGSHYSAEVWPMMLDRIFGGEQPLEHPDFGELRQ